MHQLDSIQFKISFIPSTIMKLKPITGNYPYGSSTIIELGGPPFFENNFFLRKQSQ